LEQELWIAPLLLIPGVALLIMSTSARYGQLHSEIHHVADLGPNTSLIKHLFRRARWMRNALVSLYLSVAVFAVTSLVTALFTCLEINSPMITFWMICLGVSCLVFAVFTLIRESIQSLEVIRDHTP